MRRVSILAVLITALFPAFLVAQGSDTALLRGTVTDASGAVVPNVTVTMTNVATGVSEKRPTDAAGRYVFTDLKPAAYRATVEATGFKTLVRENIVLRVGQQTDLDLTLEVGEISQKVEVSAEAPLLNTVSGALGTEVTGQYMTNMPLEGRDYSPLVFLAPGTTEVAGAGGISLGGTGFASNGQRYATAEFRLDGGLQTNPEGGEGGTTNLQYKPVVEAIQEFKLQNNSFSAEYGSNGGTVVSLLMKSGTNQFHGSGYWFFRRPELDANDFFSNAAGQPIGPYDIDQWGGTVGGPIKKNKTFFFFDYERDRNTYPSTKIASVPTDLQKNGDFSQTFNPDGSLETIFNPFNQTCTVDQVCTRTPFPGNIVPLSAMDKIGKNLINLYPEPNTTGDPITGLNNYTAKLVNPSPSYQYDIKIDHSFSDSNRFSARYSRGDSTNTTPNPFLATVVSYYHIHEGAVSDTWTISPKTLWTNRLNLHRFVNTFGVPPTVDPLSVGFPKDLIVNPWYEKSAFPDISVNGYQSLVRDACCTTSLETDTQWSFSSVVDKIMGSHELRFGGERRIFLNAYFQPDDTAGGFEFSPNQTMQSNVSPDPLQGNALASMLLGYFDGNSGMAERPSVANKSSETSFFIQDNWRVTSRLTLNLGLRYEFSTPYTERYNREAFSCFVCDSGINVPGVGELHGTTILATNNQRTRIPLTITSDRALDSPTGWITRQ